MGLNKYKLTKPDKNYTNLQVVCSGINKNNRRYEHGVLKLGVNVFTSLITVERVPDLMPSEK